ncbi:hypothetical protein [Tenacibaculum finnmarkense]|uniref:Uncharacterized protein n=1 Tax=Tenacibaculum finnmarkense genomovar finnmarkense TaxID=1458503 RepID=A0AAP1WGY7_9FLAO|nr:hypothetical protein [Tenacibaculum finnmarkense]MCD8449704.1 hypothetical protein [Tenacibaculum dicentrarchi]MBE7653534.1 hypothetical protein [Tenacibaculum finnmarkense genomovar finnmarkense]MBE7692881.1 hypothetical protein [Tenacibaculum finnmarkense genomovar finnmarkense]MBE7695874.1 hypothetical protein [Tenacibaculum finnmarkense genomovar finnmarkense]MBE7697943.1 hypothetical protein [Tenacibaculum finnmarkense genomovar ulcerans]
MAYNQKNLLKRIIRVQTIVLQKQYENEDITYKELYWKFIQPEFLISYRTFHTYLGTPAKRELKKLENNLSVKKETPNLFSSKNVNI